MTKTEKAKLTRLFIEQWKALDRQACSLEEWVALKLGCSLTEAGRLVREAEG